MLGVSANYTQRSQVGKVFKTRLKKLGGLIQVIYNIASLGSSLKHCGNVLYINGSIFASCQNWECIKPEEERYAY